MSRIFQILFFIITFTIFFILIALYGYYFTKISLPCTFLKSLAPSKFNTMYLSNYIVNFTNDILVNFNILFSYDSFSKISNFISKYFWSFELNIYNNDFTVISNFIFNNNMFIFILFLLFIQLFIIKFNLYNALIFSKFFNVLINYSYNNNKKNIFQNLHNFKKYYFFINFFN